MLKALICLILGHRWQYGHFRTRNLLDGRFKRVESRCCTRCRCWERQDQRTVLSDPWPELA